MFTIFLPAIGHRFGSVGAVNGQTTNGYYWSSVQASSANGVAVYFASGSSAVNTTAGSKTYGFSIRCVRWKSNERGEIRDE